eukprot:TRINITY_DN3499_c0_g2_i1.p1 TRINITY_DN3499_c0_g2~~TRINITY_DN3499_c0_g2_i1.p1  ORF type:complete len:219 (+),score=11.16 TRINITY_DN3499_c0_g2_i1:51-707(+)
MHEEPTCTQCRCEGGELIKVKLPGVPLGEVHADCMRLYREEHSRTCERCGDRCTEAETCLVAGDSLIHEGCMKVKKNVRIMEQKRETVEGVLDKFSVGRIGTFKNWRTRYFIADQWSIEYYKKSTDPKPCGRVSFTPATRLRVHVTSKHHPQASDSSYHYLSLDFREDSENRTLLLRTSSGEEYEKFTSFFTTHVQLHDCGGSNSSSNENIPQIESEA